MHQSRTAHRQYGISILQMASQRGQNVYGNEEPCVACTHELHSVRGLTVIVSLFTDHAALDLFQFFGSRSRLYTTKYSLQTVPYTHALFITGRAIHAWTKKTQCSHGSTRSAAGAASGGRSGELRSGVEPRLNMAAGREHESRGAGRLLVASCSLG